MEGGRSHFSSRASASHLAQPGSNTPAFSRSYTLPRKTCLPSASLGNPGLPQLQSNKRKGWCSGICLHVTERRDLLLTPSSYSILFHCLPTTLSHVPARSIIQGPQVSTTVYGMASQQHQPASETPHRAREHTPEPEEGRQAWKMVPLGKQCSAPCALVPSPARFLPRHRHPARGGTVSLEPAERRWVQGKEEHFWMPP